MASLWCLAYFAFSLVLGCSALSNVRVSVPNAALRGDSVILHCFFDLEGDILYSVKWYKDRQEFYRYTPRETPPVKSFPIPGLSQLRVEVSILNDERQLDEEVVLDKGLEKQDEQQFSNHQTDSEEKTGEAETMAICGEHTENTCTGCCDEQQPQEYYKDWFVYALLSNATQVTLQNVSPAMSGLYSCEVSADAPSFQTALVTGQIVIVTPPKHRPSLHGLKPRYREGDTLRVNCTSAYSLPAANLSWLLNGHQVDKHYVKNNKKSMVKENGDDLDTSISILEKILNTHDFASNNRLKVRCTASILSVYWQTTEKSAEWERPKMAEHQWKPSVLLNLKTDAETVLVGKENEPTQETEYSSSISPSLLVLSSILCWSTLLLQYSLILT